MCRRDHDRYDPARDRVRDQIRSGHIDRTGRWKLRAKRIATVAGAQRIGPSPFQSRRVIIARKQSVRIAKPMATIIAVLQREADRLSMPCRSKSPCGTRWRDSLKQRAILGRSSAWNSYFASAAAPTTHARLGPTGAELGCLLQIA